MAAVPVFVVLMLQNKLYLALVVFIAAEITDVLDGIIARRYQLITPFGKVADPLADKLMQLTALFMLAQREMILKIIPWLVLVKDLFLLVSGFYVIKTKKKVDVSAKWFGKLTSVLLFIAILTTFFGAPRSVSDTIFWICVVMALFAAVMYIINYFKQMRANREHESEMMRKREA
jgi:cardiolipin synthase